MLEKITSEDLKILRNLKKESKSVFEHTKILALISIASGEPIETISKILQLHPTTIRKYVKEWCQKKKIRDDRGGSKSKLDEDQTKELKEHLSKVTYQEVKSIIFYVQETYGVTYTLSGMTYWLKAHKFSYKKPKGLPFKHNQKEQEEFKKAYENLKKTTSDPIFFMDSVHPTMATKKAYGWIPKGARRALRESGSRTRVNIIGAVNIESRDVLHHTYETINTTSVIHFLKLLVAKYRNEGKSFKTIHLFADQGGYHRSKELKAFLDEYNEVTLHLLPPHSPNLNPIERLWKILNEYERNNVFFASKKQFCDAIERFFTKTIPKIPDVLQSRITDRFETLPTFI
jgi:transposase